jgi:hypothetical protein
MNIRLSRHGGRDTGTEGAAMTGEKTIRCMVCGRPDPEDTICDHCKAQIRGEVLEQHRHEKKESDAVLHKEGSDLPRH